MWSTHQHYNSDVSGLSFFYCGAVPPTGWIVYWTKQLLCCLFLKRFFCFFNSFDPPFLSLFFSESTAPSQHWSSGNSTRTTFVPSTMNTELFMTGSGLSQRCLFSWAQRSTLSPQEHKSTRYLCRASDCSIFIQQQPRWEVRHSNASHCHYFFQLMEDQILQKYRKYKKVKKSCCFFVCFFIIIAHKTFRHHNFCKSVLWTWSCQWSLCNYTDCQKRGTVSFSIFIYFVYWHIVQDLATSNGRKANCKSLFSDFQHALHYSCTSGGA